ncbi:MAG: OadG family protein [Planctomycetota bacterium]
MTTSLTLLAQTNGFEAIDEGNGIGIAITGMAIVFSALAVISLFLRLLPIILRRLEPILPSLEARAHPPTTAEQLPSDNARIIAAIGYVLHHEMKRATHSNLSEGGLPGSGRASEVTPRPART